ncbi:MAG: phosphate ABC transporter permease subunit PstC [Planctomycetes bacterium]|nr:phosphate ABC transporter permease subunit PstC [Planctomycetota bacterium]
MSTGPSQPAPSENGNQAAITHLKGSATRYWREKIIQYLLFLAAFSSVAVTTGIVVTLLSESAVFFQQVSLWEFLTETTWTPAFDEPKHGILPLVAGTLITTGVALAVALPIGTIIAIYLSEYAPFALREIIKPILELLSAVPTVVYGYFALLFVTPWLKWLFELPFLVDYMPELDAFSMLSAGIVMGIMIIPYVSSLSEDAMRSVPMLLREGAYALGANKLITSIRVVYPSALSGIGAAYILGISRAIGETMIVAIAAGMQPNLTWNPAEPASTITAYIVQVSKGELPREGPGYKAIFAAGLTLFVMTLGFNIVGHILRKRYREAY